MGQKRTDRGKFGVKKFFAILDNFGAFLNFRFMLPSSTHLVGPGSSRANHVLIARCCLWFREMGGCGIISKNAPFLQT